MACLRIKAVAMVLILSTLVASIAAHNTLYSGHTLATNHYLVNGPYSFIIQGDCDLVLYVNNNRALWSSGTSGGGTACEVTLQNDGNLVILSGTDTVWSSKSSPGTSPYVLVLQSNGDAVIYGNGGNGSPVWDTNSN